MKTIWKMPLAGPGSFSLLVPAGAKTLTVQVQNDVPCVWMLCDDQAEKTARKFVLCGTGHPAPEGVDNMNYIGTFQLARLVFHLFEVPA